MFADSNRTKLAIISESAWGNTPATPEFTEIRKKNHNFKSNIETAVSEEVRSDGMVPGQTIVGGSSSLQIDGELSFGEYDLMFEHALMKDPTTAQTITGTDLSLSGDQILSTGNAFEAAKNLVGQWIKIKGSATNTNNDIFKIATFSTGALTLTDKAGAAASFTADSANASLSYSSSVMYRNGMTKKSLSIEEALEDISVYYLYAGGRVNDFSLNMNEKGIIEISINLLAKSPTSATSTADNAGGYTAVGTSQIMNAAGNVIGILENGVTFPGTFKSWNLNIARNLREQQGVGNSTLSGIGLGKCVVTGSAEIFSENKTYNDKFANNTGTSFAFITKDSSNNYYVITVPNAFFTDLEKASGGSDSDIMENYSFQGYRDNTTDCQIQIDKIAA